jgi:hypothetical protein
MSKYAQEICGPTLTVSALVLFLGGMITHCCV